MVVVAVTVVVVAGLWVVAAAGEEVIVADGCFGAFCEVSIVDCCFAVSVVFVAFFYVASVIEDCNGAVEMVVEVVVIIVISGCDCAVRINF